MGVIRRWMWVALVTAVTLSAQNKPAAPKAPSASRPATAVQPNIVLITLDTTRADRMGFLGSKRGLTPNLDALADQSAVFTHAYSQAPLTPTSHATILTGTYPQFHQVSDFRVPLAKELPYAPAILRAQGYKTAAFVGSIVLDPSPSYAPGFDRGFDTYDAGFHYEGVGEDHYHTVERRGAEVVAHALAWLDEHPKGPFFMWVHLYDPHDPYEPPEPYKTRYAEEPYDGEIAYTDAAVGKLLTQLKTRGLYDDTMIAVMADHGESLGAHGEDTHGIFLYDETIQVPLLMKLPHGSGKRIENRVELVDVLPTMLQALNVMVPGQVQGKSLLGLMKPEASSIAESPSDAARQGNSSSSEEAWRDRPAYSQTEYPHTAFGWSALQSLRSGKYLYVQAPRRELYDEASDPKADHNLATASTAVADTLAGRLAELRQKTTSHGEAPKATVDPTAQEKLAALGYVSGAANISSGSGDQGADPKDKIQISNIFHEANSLRQRGHLSEAATLLRQLSVEEPTLPGIYAKLGDCLLDMKDYQQAVPVLRKAMQLDPESPMTHLQLAKALMGAGDFESAVPELEFAVAKVPGFADAHVFLESAYAHTHRVPETIKECKIVLDFLPNDFGSYLILGRFLELSGDFEAAIPNLKKAAALRPKAPEPHMFLADAYDQLGRKTAAASERAIAKSLAAGGGNNP